MSIVAENQVKAIVAIESGIKDIVSIECISEEDAHYIANIFNNVGD
jgi:hypothetical protein